MDYVDIINLISFGRDNARSLTYLSDISGISMRSVKKLIHKARSDGHVIISTTQPPSGYFRPSHENGIEECLEYVETMHKCARSYFKQTKPARDYIEKHTVRDIANPSQVVSQTHEHVPKSISGNLPQP